MARPPRRWAGSAPPDAMTGSKQGLRLTGKIVPDYLSPGDWSGGMLSKCLDNEDLISEHFYSYNNQRFDIDKGDRVPVNPPYPLVEWARQPATQVRVKYEHYQEYLARIPGLKAKPVPIALDEWAYNGVPSNSYKLVLAYAWAFHEMFRHSDLYQMAGFTFATSLAIQGVDLSGKGKLWRMAPATLNATIVVGQKPGVTVEQSALDAVPATATVAPFSVSIYELAVK